MPKKSFDSLLEYRLMDALEMNYSQNGKAIRAAKSKLLKENVRDQKLHPLFTFRFADRLVVIHNGVRRPFRKLFLLDSRKVAIQELEFNRSSLRQKGGNGK